MDPLAQLKDIHLPEQVGFWPLAPGWWILVLLSISAVVLLLRALLKQRELSKVKRQALKQLSTQQSLTTVQILSLLKWASMHYYNRQDVASKYSNELLDFFTSKLAKDKQQAFVQQAEKAITRCYRKSSVDLHASEFQQAAIYWLNNAALLPKQQVKLEAAND
ncbi:DUF4381 domain-containing protein [Thalassotalea aquiviva]|uniref:DUF4381 domain-containing protein n=1 Tax=Thalassotalea aquiviva TaxID=3242415 RepID=UPI00352A1C22